MSRVVVLLALAACHAAPHPVAPVAVDWAHVPAPRPLWWFVYDQPCKPPLAHADLPDEHRCLASDGSVAVSWLRNPDVDEAARDFEKYRFHWPATNHDPYITQQEFDAAAAAP